MKFLALVLAAASVQVGTAFSPSIVPRTSRAATKAHMIDPSGLDDLIQHVDAVRVTLMECDKEGCVMAEGVKNGDMWQVNGGLQPGTDSTVKVISFAMDDTE